jgi:hypothetical protein
MQNFVVEDYDRSRENFNEKRLFLPPGERK